MTTIALDVDSVLFPINEWIVLPEMRKTYPWITMGDITTFDWEKCVGSEAKKIAYSVYQRPDLYDGYELEPHIRTVVNQLRDTYDRVIAVSSPFQQHASSKWAYCQRAGFAHGDIVICGDKTLVKFDVLVDDRLSTCEAVGPDRAIIFDRPWNRAVSGDLSFERAYDWADVARKIARLVTPTREAQDVDDTIGGTTGYVCPQHAELRGCCICGPRK